jgi:general secretion pathway protein I
MATTESTSSGFGHAGFSLLEVMIALAIAGIALVSLLSLANRSLAVHDRLQKITQATLLAQHQMAVTEVDAQSGLRDFTTEQGTFEEPFELYRWRLEYTETPLPSVWMITVTVSWGDEAENETVALDSFIF